MKNIHFFLAMSNQAILVYFSFSINCSFNRSYLRRSNGTRAFSTELWWVAWIIVELCGVTWYRSFPLKQTLNWWNNCIWNLRWCECNPMCCSLSTVIFKFPFLDVAWESCLSDFGLCPRIFFRQCAWCSSTGEHYPILAHVIPRSLLRGSTDHYTQCVS